MLNILLVLCAGCGAPQRTAEPCRVVESPRVLPEAVRESSGIAISSFDAATLWTHNDANNTPHIHAIDAAGTLTTRAVVTGAELVDWEDMEAAPCGDGTCLYIGDIGDNDETRSTITIYEVAEPRIGATATEPARAIRARYPDRAQDAEALFSVNGVLHIVTKGRSGAIGLYRVPQGTDVTLEPVRELMPQPRNSLDRVTGASTSRDGAWVVVRTYRALYFYPAQALVSGEAVQPVRQDISGLGEDQGEGVAMDVDGTVWLTSEAENRRAMPTRTRLQCTLPQR